MNMDTENDLSAQKQYFLERKESLVKDLKKIHSEISEKRINAGEKILEGGDELAKRVLDEIGQLQTREALLIDALDLADRNIIELSKKVDNARNRQAQDELAQLRAGQTRIIQEIMQKAHDLDGQVNTFLQKVENINTQFRGIYPKVILFPSTQETIVMQLHFSLNQFFQKVEMVAPELLGIVPRTQEETRILEAEGNVERAKERLQVFKSAYEEHKSSENDDNVEKANLYLDRAKKALSNLKSNMN
jgi:hypothetical protein